MEKKKRKIQDKEKGTKTSSIYKNIQYLAEEKATPKTRIPFPWLSSMKSSSSSTCWSGRYAATFNQLYILRLHA